MSTMKTENDENLPTECASASYAPIKKPQPPKNAWKLVEEVARAHVIKGTHTRGRLSLKGLNLVSAIWSVPFYRHLYGRVIGKLCESDALWELVWHIVDVYVE